MGKKRSSSLLKSSSSSTTGKLTIVLYDRVAQDAELTCLAKQHDDKIAWAEEEAGIAVLRIICREAVVEVFGSSAAPRIRSDLNVGSKPE